jgi:hypothetical protein
MCNVRSSICVHSCEKVNGIDGEERNLSSLSLSPSLRFFFFSLSSGEKEFEILSHTRTYTACCSLAYILAIDSTSSYEISEP